MNTQHKYEIRLVGIDSEVPAVQRLRAALKMLRRSYGLRCVGLVEVRDAATCDVAGIEDEGIVTETAAGRTRDDRGP